MVERTPKNAWAVIDPIKTVTDKARAGKVLRHSGYQAVRLS